MGFFALSVSIFPGMVSLQGKGGGGVGGVNMGQTASPNSTGGGAWSSVLGPFSRSTPLPLNSIKRAPLWLPYCRVLLIWGRGAAPTKGRSSLL